MFFWNGLLQSKYQSQPRIDLPFCLALVQGCSAQSPVVVTSGDSATEDNESVVSITDSSPGVGHVSTEPLLGGGKGESQLGLSMMVVMRDGIKICLNIKLSMKAFIHHQNDDRLICDK